MSRVRPHKTIVKGTDILVFNEVGELMETVPATRDHLANFFGYRCVSRQWEDEIVEEWKHMGSDVAEPDWTQCRKDYADFIRTKWSYEA